MKCLGWSATIPKMVTYHQIYQKELYCRHGIWHLGLLVKLSGWSATILRMVTQHQNLSEGFVLQTFNFVSRLNSQN